MKFTITVILFFTIINTVSAKDNVVLNINFINERLNSTYSIQSFNNLTQEIEFLKKDIKLNYGDNRISLSIDHPQEVWAFNHYIFIEPNQSYNIQIGSTENEFLSYSRNRGNILWRSLITRDSIEVRSSDSYKGSEEYLKELLNKNCLNKLRKIDSLKSLDLITAVCYKYAYNEIYYNYLIQLTHASKAFNIYPDSSKSIFLRDFEMSKFKDASNLQSKSYCLALFNYAVNILTARKKGEISSAHFINARAIIETKFGSQKNFLLLALYRQYCLAQIDSLKNLINDNYYSLDKKIKDTTCKIMLRKYFAFYSKANKPLPANILNASLLSSDSLDITLSHLLKAAGSKPIILSFWASWCKPCLQEIEKYKEDEIAINEKAAVIFISIDKDLMPFQSKSKELSIRSYNVDKKFTNDYLDYFMLKSIPHSFLIVNGVAKDIDFNFRSFLEGNLVIRR